MKRVVVTGMGAITPIGKNVNETWEGIKNKKCGIDKITLADVSDFKTQVAAEVKEYDENEYFDKKEARNMDRYSQFAIISAREAYKDSGITPENTDLNRVGIFISSGIGGLNTIKYNVEFYLIKDIKEFHQNLFLWE